MSKTTKLKLQRVIKCDLKVSASERIFSLTTWKREELSDNAEISFKQANRQTDKQINKMY